MPSSSVSFRAICGNFYWTFLNFMSRRAREKRAMRCRVVCVSGKVAVVLVFLVACLLQCGDVETNPGPSIADVVKVLTAMDKKMEERIENLQTSMQEHMEKFQANVAHVTKENKELKEKVDRLESRVDDLEGRSRRNNLIFHGIPSPQGKTELWSDCEKAVKTALKEEMGLTEEVEIERAHRLGSEKSDRPIIICFGKFKDKERILASRKVLREKRSKIFVNEDFTPRVRESRRLLLPFLKKAKAEQKRAFLRFDTLVIEGKAYVYDTNSQGLVSRQGGS
eukprot:TRINITY_DN35768_c1_g2_i1.p1 TRINITY_DN35768_c1_g2~~TRINITY_DN35768_c1_g2_i1.p1  ORF type:complete len:280 (+),score=57.69 TRINITY_DN35768_c1_g2_i1:199-1038(+)